MIYIKQKQYRLDYFSERRDLCVNVDRVNCCSITDEPDHRNLVHQFVVDIKVKEEKEGRETY